MKTQLYSIFDTVAEIFNKPFVEHNDSSASRAFIESLAENNNKNDYVLYKLGSYNDANGEIQAHDPIKIMMGLDIKNNVVNIAEK